MPGSLENFDRQDDSINEPSEDQAIVETSETNEVDENYDDCAKSEVQEDSLEEQGSAEATEEVDDYDDCRLEESPEAAEHSDEPQGDYDDYDDCRLEQDNQEFQEQEELEEQPEDVQEETTETAEEVEPTEETDELQGQEECEDQPEDVQEETPETAEEAEPTEETDELQEQEELEEQSEDVQEETPETAEEVEQTEETDELQEQEEFEEQPEEAQEGTPETAEEVETTEESDELQEQEELEEVQKETPETAVQAEPTEDSEELQEQDGLEEQPEEVQKETLETAEEVEKTGKDEDLQNAIHQREENAEKIEKLELEKQQIENDSEEKFKSLVEQERNTDEYKKALKEYNDLKDHQIKVSSKLEEAQVERKELDEKINSILENQAKENVDKATENSESNSRVNSLEKEIETQRLLENFKQANWENLSVSEKKDAITELAGYNAELLTIEDRPSVVFVQSDDFSEFGYYDPEKNEIIINENNIDNAIETADTVSHESRHCFQCERAEKLENELDYKFKESLDNYIAPENDYAAYRNQLVEKDAQDYAERITNRITGVERTVASDELKEGFSTKGHVRAFEEINPEKGAVFDKEASKIEPTVHFEKKLETRDFHETYESKELQEIEGRIAPLYDNGAAIAEYIKEFNTYKEHHIIEGGHIGKVHDKSLQAADVLEDLFKRETYGGLYSPNIDRRSLEMMAYYHDTGMDGNVPKEKFEQAKEEYLNTPGRRDAYVRNLLEKEPDLTKEQANNKFEKEAYESQFRKEHPVQSAIHVLRDRDFIEKHGVDANQVAIGCLMHSKSNSGVKNMADESQWNEAIARLNDAVTEFNIAHPDEKIEFDDSFLRNSDRSFNKEKLSEMRSEFLCLRIGDANGHDSKSCTSQNGKEYGFSLDDWNIFKDSLSPEMREKIKLGDCTDFFSEAKLANVEVGGVKLNDANDPSGFSRMFAVGEGNFKSLDLKLVDDIPTQIFELENGDAYPLSTQYCILERLKEYNTAKVEPDKSIEKPPGMAAEDFDKYKQYQLDAMQKIDFVAEINVGSCDEVTRESYESFAAKVKDQYGIAVVIVCN